MNLRQKAKRFKRLYEETLKQPVGYVIKQEPLKHYKAATRISRHETWGLDTEILERVTVDRLTEKLKPLVKATMYCTEDIERDCFECSIDLWVK